MGFTVSRGDETVNCVRGSHGTLESDTCYLMSRKRGLEHVKGESEGYNFVL